MSERNSGDIRRGGWSASRGNELLPTTKTAKLSADLRKISPGAKKIAQGFDDKQRTKVQNSFRIGTKEINDTLRDFEDTAPDDLTIALLVARVEKSDLGEIAVQNLLRKIGEKCPQLSATFLKNMRTAVAHIIETEARALARGDDANIVDSTDYTDQVNFASEKLRIANDRKPTIFMMDGKKVEVAKRAAGVTILDMSFERFETLLNTVCQFRSTVGDGYKGVAVPRDVAKFLHNCHDLPLPELNGVSGVPFFDKNGRLVRSPGFDETTGIYLDLGRLDIPRVPKEVSAENVADAVGLLSDVFGDFELDGVSRNDLESSILDSNDAPPASFLNLVGACLEQFVRPMIDGPVMPMLISKTSPGAGGGLIVQVIQQIVIGSSVTRPLATDEDARRKAILAMLKSGTAVVSWDNVTGNIDSPSMASLFTEERWTDRTLNYSSEQSLPVRCSFILVGNRPLLSRELQRRMSLVELKPNTPTPETRTGFKYPHLMQHAKTARSDLVWALLVIVRNWTQRNCPKPMHAPEIGSYEAYRNVIGGILESVAPHWTSWQQNRGELEKVADNGDDEGIRELMRAIWTSGLQSAATTSDIAALAEADEISLPVKTVQGQPFVYNTTSLGMYLRTGMGTVFDVDGEGTHATFGKSDKRGKTSYPWTLTRNPA